MKLKSMPSTLLIMLVVLFASCSQKASVPVPEDAGLVFHLDGASLNSKLSWDEVKQGGWFETLYNEADDSLARTIMNDIEQSGLDVKGDAFIFLTARGRGSYATITCGIRDETKFKKMVTKVKKNETILTEDGLSIMKDDDNVLTWNSDRMVFVGDVPGFNSGASFMSRGGDESPFTEDSLLKFAKAVYSLKKKNSLANDSKFMSMMKEKGDAHFWMNSSAMYSGSMPSMLALTKASLLFEGNMTAATLNFGDGQITIDAKSYYNDELAKIYEKYSMKNIDESMLKKIPSQNVAAVIAMNYPPEGLKEFLTLLGVDGLINMFLAQEGFSIDDFIKANKGDILFAVTDFEVKDTEKRIDESDPKSPTTTRKEPDANILFATSVNDKASFEKMVMLINQKLNEVDKLKTMASKVPYELRNDVFVAGNDSATVHAYGTGSTDHAFISKISGHPMGGFMDIQKFINGAKAGIGKDSSALLVANESLKYWQDIVFYGGEIKNNAATSHVEINMVDKKTNSLKQLNKYFDFLFQSIYTKNRWHERRERSGVDSVTAPKAF